MKDYYTLALEQGKLCPDPIVGNADTAAVYANIKEVSPNLGQIVQGVLTGKTDYKDSLNTLAENTQKEWDNGIAKAKEAGANVSAADFEFKNSASMWPSARRTPPWPRFTTPCQSMGPWSTASS